MIDLLNHSKVRARRTRTRAVEYATHGWPVAPLAVPLQGQCPCGSEGGCPSPHLVGPVRGIVDPMEAHEVWTDTAWSIALVASRFDVVAIPSPYGANLHHKLITACATAAAFRGRRWWFVMETGSIAPELAVAAGGRVYSGPSDWVPAPPTRTEATGRIGWIVEPRLTYWKPYKRLDLVDLAFAGLESTVSPGLPGVTDKLIEQIR